MTNQKTESKSILIYSNLGMKDSKSKLILLGESAKFDVCGYPRILHTIERAHEKQKFSFVYSAVGEGGRCVKLFKVLQTNKCERNCYYCANRRNRDYPRISFTPKELANLFMEYYTNGLVDGCFLSSAIHNTPDASQERIIQTLQILRKKYKYKGYIHTKILPGASNELIFETAKYSDRLSINLEAPGQDWLNRLSPHKNYATLISKLRKISEIAYKNKLKDGVTTQLVVGGGGESDRSIINLVFKLYKEFKLWRVYYSGFIPVENTPLQNTPICPPIREYRLYQADSLIRKYGFTPEEVPFSEDGFLSVEDDPKLAWAKLHPEVFPIEVNKASFHDLIRVPGIGTISAQKIISTRKENKIVTLETLTKMGIITRRARSFITVNGHLPTSTSLPKNTIHKQLFLWDEI